MAEEKRWLSRKEASRYLETIGCPISARRLAEMASNDNQGKGPPYNRVGWTRVYYDRADLRLWAEGHITRVE